MSGRTLRVSLAFLSSLALLAAGCSGGGGGGSFSDPLDHLVVSPDGATIDTSTTVAVKATGVTKTGRHVEVTGVTWEASAGSVSGDQFTPSAAGDATLTATAEGKTGTGTIHVEATGTLDVQVVDAATGAGIQAATVMVLGSGGTASTAADGSATVTGSFSGAVGVQATATNYVPMTLFDVKARKIRIPLRPVNPPAGGGFNGTIDFHTAFQSDDPPSGSLWVGIAGPSIKGNVLAFGLDSLLGPSRPISISGFNLDAPSNVFVYGVTTDYEAVAPAGSTVAWALGGEITLQQITDVIGSGSSDLGSVITQLLPTFNTFYYTVKDGLTITSNQTLQGQDLILDTKLENVTTLNVPPRPDTDPNPLVVGAIDFGAEGFVPAGLTVVDGETAPSTTVHVPKLEGQFADKSYVYLTVSQEGGLGSSNSDQQLAVLSRGLTKQTTVDMPEFLVPPAVGSFSATGATRVVSYPATQDAQLTLQTFSRSVAVGTSGSITYEWDVATDGASTGYTLPMVAGTNAMAAGAGWTVQSLGLESETYDALLSQGAPVDLSSYFGDADRVVITHANVQ